MSLIFSEVPLSEVGRVIFYPRLEEKNFCAAYKIEISISGNIRLRGVFDVECWTDGSVVDRIGAGAACIYSNDYVTPAGHLCSSYHAELIIIKAALVTLVAESDGNKKQ